MKLIGKTYPLDVVIDMDKVREIRPAENGDGLSIQFKDWSTVNVRRLVNE